MKLQSFKANIHTQLFLGTEVGTHSGDTLLPAGTQYCGSGAVCSESPLHALNHSPTQELRNQRDLPNEMGTQTQPDAGTANSDGADSEVHMQR